MEVPKSALALLHIGLDHEPAGSGSGVALIPLLELGGDELGPSPFHHLVAKSLLQGVGEADIAGQTPGLQQRGPDGHVTAGELDGLRDGPRGVADLKAQIPKGVEHELDDALAVGGDFVRTQKQQVDVGEGRHLASPVPPDSHDGQPFALGGIAGPEHVNGGEIIEGGDHLIGDGAQQPGGFHAPGPVLETLLGDHAAAKQRRLEDHDGATTLLGLVADSVKGGGGKQRPKAMAVDDVLYGCRAQARGHGRRLYRASLQMSDQADRAPAIYFQRPPFSARCSSEALRR